MGIKKNVFGSRAEKENFYKLQKQWNDKYKIYHNLPLLNVFNVANSHPNFTYLKNTSIDYTFCDSSDRPLFCIEFDGMQNGFNSHKSYYARKQNSSERQRRIELKLSIADIDSFPLIIVGYDEFRDLSNNIKLTIVDGIVGVITANMNWKDIQKEAEDYFEKSKYFIDDTEEIPYELIDDLIEKRWNHFLNFYYWKNTYINNPIMRKFSELRDNYINYFKSYTIDYISYPNGANLEMELMFDTVKNARFIGAKCTVESPKFGKIESSVFLPNIKSHYCRVYHLPNEVEYYIKGYCEEGAVRDCCLVSNIASLLAFEKLAERVEQFLP